ncbi:VOC family protein [Actinoplanes sp. NPDC051494]|uniref:VOC family protein n=1 Tax=Actinoplanes sp. NPDC051494 TaxID=3363907 RepID=UPI00379A0DB1
MVINAVRHITVDAHDPAGLARFWAEVTGYRMDPEFDDEEALLFGPGDGSPGILFVAVPEAKAVKNRVHLDIEPPVGTRDEFVERMLALGATVFEDHRLPDGRGWVTMRDPEGNEFCVERSTSERNS